LVFTISHSTHSEDHGVIPKMRITRRVHIIRHAQSLYNMEMQRVINWFKPKFWWYGFEPGIKDPQISELGHEQVARYKDFITSIAEPDVILVSPLRRALQTATGIWGSKPMRAIPIMREIASTQGDVGNNPDGLKVDFPHVDFDNVTNEWWKGEGTPAHPKHWTRESRRSVENRIKEFKEIILNLPDEQEHIFCVGHSQFFKRLTNAPKMKNVGCLTIDIHDDHTVTVVENYSSCGDASPNASTTNSSVDSKSVKSNNSKNSAKVQPEN